MRTAFICMLAFVLAFPSLLPAQHVPDTIPFPGDLLLNESQDRLVALQQEYFPTEFGSFITSDGNLIFTSRLTFSYQKKYIGQDLLQGKAGRDVYLLTRITGTPESVIKVWTTYFEPKSAPDQLLDELERLSHRRLNFIYNGVEHSAFIETDLNSNMWYISVTLRFH